MRLFNWVPSRFKVDYKPLITALVIVLSFISTAVFPSATFAATTSSSIAPKDPNYLNWQIQSNWYLQATTQCLTDPGWALLKANASFNLGEPNIKSGDWIYNNPVTGDGRSGAVGFYMRDTLSDIGDDGKMSCASNGSELFKKALSQWGIDSLTAACDSGIFRRDNNTDCKQGNGNFSLTDSAKASGSAPADLFKSYIIKTVYNGNTPQLSDAMQFILHKRTLVMGCAYSSQTAYTTRPSGAQVYEVASVYTGTPDTLNPNQTTQQQTKQQVGSEYYIGDQSPDTQRWLWTNPDSQKTCQQLADAITPGSAYANAYAAYLKLNDLQTGSVDTTTGGTKPGDTSSKCQVPGLGWIICPVVNFLASIADKAYSVVKALLTVPALNTDTSSKTNGAYIAWSYMRNIANVLFVIAFIIIIYSQITGMGVSNYGIKKLLPKLIIAAILVNASYWVCAVAVDLSNIIGTSLRSLLDAAAAQMPAPHDGTPLDKDTVWGDIATVILASATAYALGLTILLPILITTLAAAVTVLVALVLRQALIIILIFISPIAFVALLLPNTEKLFERWRQAFTVLLMMFPVIALVFGGSNLASRVLSASTISVEGDNGWFLRIVAAGVTVIPLFVVPALMKLGGGLLNRFAGVVNNQHKGVFDRARKGADTLRKDRQNLRNMRALNGDKQFGRGAFVRWRARSRAISSGRENEMNRANSEYLAGQAQNNETFRNAAAGGTNFMGSTLKTASAEASQRALASAINVKAKLEADEVTAAQAIIKDANLDLEQMQAIAMGKSTTYKDRNGNERVMSAPAGSALQTAAIQNQFKAGDVAKTDELVAASGGMNTAQRQAVAEGAQSISGKVKYYGGAVGDMIKQGQIKNMDDLDEQVAQSIAGKKYSEQDLANQDKDALARIAKVASKPTTQNADVLRDIAKSLEADTKIYPSVDTRRKERIAAIRSGNEFGSSGQTPGQGQLF